MQVSKMKFLFSLLLIAFSFKAEAACFVSFISSGQSTDSNVDVPNLGNGLSKALTLYETCQHDYVISIRSSKGGLEATVRLNKVDYDVSYNGGIDVGNAKASETINNPIKINRSITALRAANHEAPDWTPTGLASTITLNRDPQYLPTGIYKDTLIIEMMTP